MPKAIKTSQSDDVFPPKEEATKSPEYSGEDFPFETIDFKSKEDSSKSEFVPLKAGVYELSVLSAKVEERPVYNKPTEMEKVIQMTYFVEKSCDGGPIMNIEGGEEKDGVRRLWDSLSMTATGYKNGGTEPSKTRACVCALKGVNPDLPFTFSSLKEIDDKHCKAFIDVVNRKKDGQKANKISKYMSL
jgi:hypothetical protein